MFDVIYTIRTEDKLVPAVACTMGLETLKQKKKNWNRLCGAAVALQIFNYDLSSKAIISCEGCENWLIGGDNSIRAFIYFLFHPHHTPPPSLV